MYFLVFNERGVGGIMVCDGNDSFFFFFKFLKLKRMCDEHVTW